MKYSFVLILSLILTKTAYAEISCTAYKNSTLVSSTSLVYSNAKYTMPLRDDGLEEFVCERFTSSVEFGKLPFITCVYFDYTFWNTVDTAYLSQYQKSGPSTSPGISVVRTARNFVQGFNKIKFRTYNYELICE